MSKDRRLERGEGGETSHDSTALASILKNTIEKGIEEKNC